MSFSPLRRRSPSPPSAPANASMGISVGISPRNPSHSPKPRKPSPLRKSSSGDEWSGVANGVSQASGVDASEVLDVGAGGAGKFGGGVGSLSLSPARASSSRVKLDDDEERERELQQGEDQGEEEEGDGLRFGERWEGGVSKSNQADQASVGLGIKLMEGSRSEAEHSSTTPPATSSLPPKTLNPPQRPKSLSSPDLITFSTSSHNAYKPFHSSSLASPSPSIGPSPSSSTTSSPDALKMGLGLGLGFSGSVSKPSSPSIMPVISLPSSASITSTSTVPTVALPGAGRSVSAGSSPMTTTTSKLNPQPQSLDEPLNRVKPHFPRPAPLRPLTPHVHSQSQSKPSSSLLNLSLSSFGRSSSYNHNSNTPHAGSGSGKGNAGRQKVIVPKQGWKGCFELGLTQKELARVE